MAIRLEITAPQPGKDPLKITAQPRMPAVSCGACLREYSNGTVTFFWTVTISWKGNGTSSSRQFTGSSTARNSDATSWDVPFGGVIIGGDVAISVQAKTPQGQSYLAQSSPIKIVGTQPTADAILQAIGTDPWYISRIARQENNLRQFDGDGAPSLNSEGDGGAGIFQVSGSDQTYQDIWDWTHNIASGKKILASKTSGASSFWDRQVKQFNDWNTAHPKAPVAAPADLTYNDVTFSFDPKGTNRSFADAIAIKMNNGATTNFISWNNVGANADNPQWRINDTNEKGRNYVKAICDTSA
jgi:hypothetical protein